MRARAPWPGPPRAAAAAAVPPPQAAAAAATAVPLAFGGPPIPADSPLVAVPRAPPVGMPWHVWPPPAAGEVRGGPACAPAAAAAPVPNLDPVVCIPLSEYRRLSSWEARGPDAAGTLGSLTDQGSGVSKARTLKPGPTRDQRGASTVQGPKQPTKKRNPRPEEGNGHGAQARGALEPEGRPPKQGGCPHLGGGLRSLGADKPSGVRTDLIIDSGASVCAAPGHLVGSGTPDGTERPYKTACGNSLVPEGVAQGRLRGMDGKPMNASFRVMPVTRPLVSVSQVVDKGSWVVFRPESEGGSYLWTPDGTKKKLFCRNGVYVLPCWIGGSSGFQRQPRKA